MSEDTTLRDELARERTKLSNERTLLAYGRTVLGLVGLAILIFKFNPTVFGVTTGLCMLTAAVSVSLLGFRSYRLAASRIEDRSERTEALALSFEEHA